MQNSYGIQSSGTAWAKFQTVYSGNNTQVFRSHIDVISVTPLFKQWSRNITFHWRYSFHWHHDKGIALDCRQHSELWFQLLSISSPANKSQTLWGQDWASDTTYKHPNMPYILGVDRYVFFRADTDTDYYRSSRPITDILNRYTCLV